MVFPVGQQHQHLVIVLFLERRQRRVDRLGHGRAALGNRVHIQRFDALPKSRVIHRQRAL